MKVPAGWQKILDYWKGGAKPSAEEAYKGMMELAANVKIENCIYHRDVIDAMFRQTKTNDVIPFKQVDVKSGTIIAAVDYDLGRNGFAYFDKDTANYWVANGGQHSDGNKGKVYRNDGVDISAVGENLFVDHFETDEWLQYTVNVARQSTLTIAVSIQSKTEGILELNCNGNKMELPVSNTNGQWQKVKSGKIVLKTGANKLRVKVVRGEINFQSVQFN